MNFRKFLIATSGALMIAGAVTANPIVYNFSPGPSDHSVGSASQTLTVSGVKLTATGYLVANNATTILYDKYTAGSPSETGLGTLVDAGDHEITDDQYVQLDVSDLLAHHYDYLTIMLGSLQANEKGIISYGSNAGQLNTHVVATVTGGAVSQSYTVDLTSGVDYIDITGGGPNANSSIDSGDIVIESATARVPDAGSTVAMVGAALTGLAALRRRFTK